MKVNINVFFFFILIWLLNHFNLYASSISDPSLVGVCARSISLGQSYIALANDSSSIFLNPAGLSDISKNQICSLRSTLFNDVNYTVLSWAFLYDNSNFGIGWANSSLSGIPLTTWTNISGVLRPQIYGYTDYSSSVFVASYGTKLDKIFGIEKLKNISIGLNLKYFTQSFSEGFTSLEGASGAGVDLDLGVKLRASSFMDIAMVVTNVLPQSIGGGFVWKRNSITENIPTSIKVGSSIRLFGENSAFQKIKQDLIWLIDLERQVDTNSTNILLHSGIEWKPINLLSLRLGIDQQNNAQTNNLSPQTNLTYGVGINIAQVAFDYAFYSNSVINENSNHFFSLKFGF